MPKYERNQYSDGFSFCGLIIGGIFLYAGISEIFGRGWWGIGVWWIGLFFVVIGGSIIGGNLRALYNRDRLKNLVLNEITLKKTTNVEEIAQSTGLSTKDVRHIVMDLKLEGKLFVHYDKDTGEIRDAHSPVTPGKPANNPPVSFPNPTPDPLPTPKSESGRSRKYCPYCGNVLSTGAKFCSFCGGEL
ncbi:MAG: zinc ribbon domain-containing protein [Promethearchaeota archaeon]